MKAAKFTQLKELLTDSLGSHGKWLVSSKLQSFSAWLCSDSASPWDGHFYQVFWWWLCAFNLISTFINSLITFIRIDIRFKKSLKMQLMIHSTISRLWNSIVGMNTLKMRSSKRKLKTSRRVEKSKDTTCSSHLCGYSCLKWWAQLHSPSIWEEVSTWICHWQWKSWLLLIILEVQSAI